jgi:hypothetical protein
VNPVAAARRPTLRAGGTDRFRRALLPAVVVALPLVAAAVGARGPQQIRLNFGPGDGPYVSGFSPEYEIDEGVATHWTTYHARVSLPVRVSGAASARYRFARMWPQTAQVAVQVADQTVDRFSCRGGQFLERSVPLPSVPWALAIDFHTDSHERQDRGLRMDWLSVDVPAGGRVRLAGGAVLAPALVVALVWALLWLGGWGPQRAALLALPASLAATVGLLLAPWLVHRLLRGVPLALVLFGAAGLAVGQWLVARGRCSPAALRALTALGLAAFLIRALAVSHPDFYYPDQRTHARFVDFVRHGGLDFLRSPSTYIADHGVWRTGAHGKTYAFPYTPAFHAPFALIGPALTYDQRLTAMKLFAVGLSVVPLLLVWALARRLGAPPWGAGLMVLIPTYTSRLSFAFLPALGGHAVDIAFLYWLSGRLDRLREPRVAAAGAAFLCACQLAYVSSVTQTTMLVGLLALALAALGGAAGRRCAVGALAMALLGSALSVAVYYRDFMPMALDLAGRALSGSGAPSRYPVQSWLAVILERTHSFFDGVYPVLAAAGLAALFRRVPYRPLLAAWVATYFLLLLGRAKVPDVFLHGHETLLATPLVCLAAGAVLGWLWEKALWGRVAAGLALLALAVQGFYGQWQAVAAQLGNAR